MEEREIALEEQWPFYVMQEHASQIDNEHEENDDEYESCFPLVDIPDDKIAWVKKVQADMLEVQKYLEGLYEAKAKEIEECQKRRGMK